MVCFSPCAGSLYVASAGSLITKQWKWCLGDRFESVPTNPPTNEVLKPYRSCPVLSCPVLGGPMIDQNRPPVTKRAPGAGTGQYNPVSGPGQHRQGYERRAKSGERRTKTAAKKQLNKKNQWNLIKLGFRGLLPNKIRLGGLFA